MTFAPSLLISELFFPVADRYSEVMNLVDFAADTGFYKTVEMGLFQDPIQCCHLRSTVEGHRLKLTQWATFIINNEELSPASLVPAQRRHAQQRLLQLIDLAADSGASTLALTSGSDPGVDSREAAKAALTDTIQAMCEHASQYSGMNIVIEHLDRYAHKRQLLGPVDETVQWITAMRRHVDNLYLGWDAAHAALNGEHLPTSLRCACGVMKNLHLSNAILDPSSADYGDHHMSFGRPGFLTLEYAVGLIHSALRDSNVDSVVNIAVEMRSGSQETMFANELAARQFLSQVINIK
ncbi:TIM barrel protein [Citrobacter freundii]|nr:TIM barrel protein [Citrobacter freundii]